MYHELLPLVEEKRMAQKDRSKVFYSYDLLEIVLVEYLVSFIYLTLTGRHLFVQGDSNHIESITCTILHDSIELVPYRRGVGSIAINPYNNIVRIAYFLLAKVELHKIVSTDLQRVFIVLTLKN